MFKEHFDLFNSIRFHSRRSCSKIALPIYYENAKSNRSKPYCVYILCYKKIQVQNAFMFPKMSYLIKFAVRMIIMIQEALERTRISSFFSLE